MKDQKTPQSQNLALLELGAKLRDRRKALRLNSVITAEASGISRVTLYRIEKGEPSVTMGSYLSVASALGLKIEVTTPQELGKKNLANLAVPKKIRIKDYKQLKLLAWQLKKSKELSPTEALDLYERNWRHIHRDDLEENEKQLIQALLATFGRERLLV